MILRDPVHGDIELRPDEVAILDTPEMQRLRGIKQLGTAYLVYPGCHHTRFEHALGTLHAATVICQALKRQGYAVSDDDESLIRAAALVHDVSHIPFGHTFEDERKVFPRHDRPERLQTFLFSGELGSLLERLGIAQRIYDMIVRGGTWQADIIAGTIDADLLDYLRRDALFSGLSQAYDARVYRYFGVADDRLVLQLCRHGMDRPDARSEVLHLLRMRYVLTERVYFHHAKVIAGAMISKAVEIAVAQGLQQEDLFTLSDRGLLDWLATEWGAACNELAQSVLTRRLYKRVYGVTALGVGEVTRWELAEAYHRPGERRDNIEKRIADEAGLPQHGVILYVPALTTFKEATVPVITHEGIIALNRAVGSRLEISALEEQYRNLWRLWVFAPASHAKAVGEAAERVLGIPNELSRSDLRSETTPR